MDQRAKAEELRRLHTCGTMLVLPNIWDPVGARILEAKGYPAVATASAAVSASLGYADGERIARSTLIDVIARIARSVAVPLTADIESGYASSNADLEDTIRLVIESGAVGINLEDSVGTEGNQRPTDEQAHRIATARGAADRAGVSIVINARIDSFMSGTWATKEDALEDCVVRAAAFREAGADCVYPIGPGDEATLRTLRARIEGPINALASATAAPLATMRAIGIDRVSFGPYVFRSCLKKFERIVEALSTSGDYSPFASDMMSRDEANAFVRQEPEGKPARDSD